MTDTLRAYLTQHHITVSEMVLEANGHWTYRSTHCVFTIDHTDLRYLRIKDLRITNPAHERNQIARQVVDTICLFAKQQGRNVRADNILSEAIQFWLAIGFRPTDEDKNNFQPRVPASCRY